jgi:hypothetical protein
MKAITKNAGVHANEDRLRLPSHRLRRYGIVSGQRMTGSPMDDHCFSGTSKIEARRKLVIIPQSLDNHYDTYDKEYEEINPTETWTVCTSESPE